MALGANLDRIQPPMLGFLCSMLLLAPDSHEPEFHDTSDPHPTFQCVRVAFNRGLKWAVQVKVGKIMLAPSARNYCFLLATC